MKKTLTLALIGAIGLCSAGVSAATIEANKAYKLKHQDTGLYFNMEIDGRGDGYGRSCASLEVDENASVVYFVQNVNNANQYRIHLKSPYGVNLSTNSNWNSIINSTDGYYWNVNNQDDGSVIFTRNGQSVGSTNCLGPNANQKSAGSPLWTNKDGTVEADIPIFKWVPEEVAAVHNVYLNISAGDKTYLTRIATVLDGETVSLPSYDSNIIELTGTIPSDAATADVTINATLRDGYSLAKLVSARAGYRNLWVQSAIGGMHQTNENGAEWFVYAPTDTNFKLYSLVYGKYVGNYSDGVGQIPFAASADDAATLKLWRKADGSEGISKSDATATGDTNFFNLNKDNSRVATWNFDDGSSWFMVFDEDAYNTNKGLYVQNAGEYKTAYELSEDLIAMYPQDDAIAEAVAKLQNVRFGVSGNNVAEEIAALKAVYDSQRMAVKYILPMPGNKTAEYIVNPLSAVAVGQNAADFLKEVLPSWYNFEVTDVIAADKYKIISETNSEFSVEGAWKKLDKVGRILSRHGDNSNVYWQYVPAENKIYSKNATNSNIPVENRLFRLNGKIEGSELYVSIQGVGAGASKWFSVPSQSNYDSGNNNGSFVETETWFKVVQNGTNTDGSFALQLANDAQSHIQDFQAANHGVGTWKHDNSQNDPASNIQFFTLIEDESGLDEMPDFVLNNRAETYPLSDGLHKYHTTSETYDADNKAFEQSLRALTAGSTFEEFINVFNQNEALVATYEINQPERERFYRFKGRSSGKYLGNVNTDVRTEEQIANNADEIIRLKMVGDADDEGNPNQRDDIYYLDSDGRLVSYTSGLCLGKFEDSDENASWNCVNKDTSDKAATLTFAGSGELGYYNLIASNGRYLGEANENVDCGTADGAGYRWEIKPVSYLPIYLGDAEETAFYTPVNLFKRDGVEASLLYVNEDATDELVKKHHDDNLAAGNGYLLKKSGESAWNGNTKCLYMQIDNSGVSAQGATDNALTGSIYPTTKTDRHFVMTGNANADNDPLFEAAAEDVPAFTAHYVAPESNTHQAFKVKIEGQQTSGIEEIVAEGVAVQGKIYDLQGRRVAKASKGIFIVNGKKMMVK